MSVQTTDGCLTGEACIYRLVNNAYVANTQLRLQRPSAQLVSFVPLGSTQLKMVLHFVSFAQMENILQVRVKHHAQHVSQVHLLQQQKNAINLMSLV
jgi:hypothetical protein